MNNDLQTLVMGDGGAAAYFCSSWSMQAAASWVLRYSGPPMFAPDKLAEAKAGGIEYLSFTRGFYDRLGTLLLFSKEIWAPFTVNGKHMPAVYWRHLSMSFHESDLKAGPNLYGRMRQVQPRDLDATAKWLKLFFGSHQRFLLCEPPLSDHAKKFDIWHYRLLCESNWLPPAGRVEVADDAFGDAGWMTFEEAMKARKGSDEQAQF